MQNNMGANCPEYNTNNTSDPESKLFPHHSLAPERNVYPESLDQKSMSPKNYRDSSFSMVLQDLIGMDNSSQTLEDGSPKIGLQYFSNPSSLVTSVTNSRETSPDKAGLPGHFAKTNREILGPWCQSAQLRPDCLSMSHLPVFAAWNDT